MIKYYSMHKVEPQDFLYMVVLMLIC